MDYRVVVEFAWRLWLWRDDGCAMCGEYGMKVGTYCEDRPFYCGDVECDDVRIYGNKCWGIGIINKTYLITYV